MAKIPPHCLKSSLPRSLGYAVFSVGLTLAWGILAHSFLPITWVAAPLWIGYAVAAGTVATGCWVIAHECGHRAFCRWNRFQDVVGYALHSALLVPYFSWQRSHAIHHARTNHVDLGETHVPGKATDTTSSLGTHWRRVLGPSAFAIVNVFVHLLLGWPLYLLIGLSGGPTRGVTNHFWPGWPFSPALFPGRWKVRVLLSDIGIVAMLVVLYCWARAVGSIVPVLLLYGGPYLVVNAWLVLYTWLHHTDVDVPHLDASQWTWVRGAFLTVDRPYGFLLDLLHHHIGSTHVAHHVCARIPHYHAKAATEALKTAYPELYRLDPTPVYRALWRVAMHCTAVRPTADGWSFQPYS